MLKVPDWIRAGLGHPWHYISLWYVILHLCAKFQLSSMIICVSRTPCPRCHTWRTFMVPYCSLGCWSHHRHQESSWYVILYLCAKFKLSSMIISESRTPCPWSHTWMTLMVPDDVILYIIHHHDMWFFTCKPNFSSLAWLKMCQEPPILEVILGGHWRFLTGILEDWVTFDVLDRPGWCYAERFIKIWLQFADIFRGVTW